MLGEINETLYKKRWSVEEYRKSLKQNASLAKSPARTATDLMQEYLSKTTKLPFFLLIIILSN
ncbi:MAG: hypothetical protein LBT05_05680 [Planctomycetaceae bacterium]|nr:hypothetical protein [Planctomycetaceae bacterium]